MFVTNPQVLSKVYKTKSKKVSQYLISNGLPLLAQDDNYYYFSNTEKLSILLTKAPQ